MSERSSGLRISLLGGFQLEVEERPALILPEGPSAFSPSSR